MVPHVMMGCFAQHLTHVKVVLAAALLSPVLRSISATLLVCVILLVGHAQIQPNPMASHAMTDCFAQPLTLARAVLAVVHLSPVLRSISATLLVCVILLVGRAQIQANPMAPHVMMGCFAQHLTHVKAVRVVARLSPVLQAISATLLEHATQRLAFVPIPLPRTELLALVAHVCQVFAKTLRAIRTQPILM